MSRTATGLGHFVKDPKEQQTQVTLSSLSMSHHYLDSSAQCLPHPWLMWDLTGWHLLWPEGDVTAGQVSLCHLTLLVWSCLEATLEAVEAWSGEPDRWKQARLRLVLVPALAHGETVGKSFPPSRPQFPHLQKGGLER